MTKSMKVLLGTSMLAFAMPSAAWAQQSDPRGQALASGPVGQSTGGETVAVPPTGGTQPAEAPGQLGDIIVTAAKTASNAQTIPLAIQTFSGEELQRAGVSSAEDLNKLLTGVQVQASGGGNSSFFVRGIGASVVNAFGDPATAFSIDGVFFSRPAGPGTTLFDLARIEVLKGPQGTLYGRNAIGGAFNVISNRPTQELGGDASVEIGNYAERRLNAALNLPLTSTLAVRAAGQISRHDGYFSDGYDDENTDSVRLSALWKPTSGLTVYLSGDYAHVGGMGSAAIPVGPGGILSTRFVVPGNPRVGPSDPRVRAFVLAASVANSPGLLASTPTSNICLGAAIPGGGAIPLCSFPVGVAGVGNDGYVDNNLYGANLTVDADLGFATLTAIGGYRGDTTNNSYALDATPQQQQTDVNQFSTEVRLASKANGSPLKWIVGAFWLKEKQSFDAQFAAGPASIPNPQPAVGSPVPATVCLPANPAMPLPPGLCVTTVTALQSEFTLALPDVEDQTYSGFGQATFSLTSRLRITGGLRYTHDDKSSTNGVSSQIFIRPSLTTSYPSSGAESFNNVSGRAGIEYDIAPRAMAYAVYSTGYHSGGINLGVPQGPVPYEYKPEYVKSYTIGVKSRLFANTLQFNLEGFWLDYKDLQVTSLNAINDGSTACSVLGIVAACPLANRVDNAGKARFRGFETDIQWRPWRGGLIFNNVLFNDSKYLDFTAISQSGTVSVYTGQTVDQVTKWTITGGASQEIPVGHRGFMLIPEVRSQYKSGTYFGLSKLPANYQPAYTQTDLTLTLQAPERRWSVSAFVRNIENRATIIQGSDTNRVTVVPYQKLNAPRTYGGSVAFHF